MYALEVCVRTGIAGLYRGCRWLVSKGVGCRLLVNPDGADLPLCDCEGCAIVSNGGSTRET